MKEKTHMIIIDIADAQNFEKKDWPDDVLFFSDEWDFRNYQCKNFINAHQNIHEEKIHGRKCIVKEVQAQEGKDFFKKHHIQGSNNLGIVYFGLFFQEKLVGVMSLGRHNRQITNNTIVLDRFCVAYGIHVQGGASKLFIRCVKWAKLNKYDQIISFSDNRLTSGRIYEVLGFQLEKNHRPDYCYVDVKNPNKRISKQSQKKSSSKCPEGMTEFQWADMRGLKKLWDKGKKRWSFPLDPTKKTWKQNLSQKCAEQNKRGNFKQSHIRGYFTSAKCSCDIFYGSSYELRCLFLLEQNELVEYFKRADVFTDSDMKSRNPDFEVLYRDKSKEIIEVKPESRFVKESDVQKQIKETQKYAESSGFKFSVWTERSSGLANDRSIIEWAKKYIAETTGNTDWIEKQKENNKKKAKKYYDLRIANDKIKFFCSFCNLEHEALRLTHDRNIAKNGRYICEKEGGKIAGSRPKDHLKKDNPYASDGKKQCNECKGVKLFEAFSPDKSKRDGYSTRCKICRAAKYKEKYQQKKSSDSQSSVESQE